MTNILVVDDAPAVLRMAKTVLGTAGYTVTLAKNGSEAMGASACGDFDIAIVDYNIPGPNGLRVIGMLRETQPHCARILMSGSLDAAMTIEAVNHGEVRRVLQKPYDGAALIEAVEAALLSRDRVSSAAENGHEEEKQLRECMADGSIRLAIQPILSAQDGHVFGYEALLRCDHPVLFGPAPVLEAAERHGLLVELGTLLAGCAARVLPNLPEATKLFINLHPRQLANPRRLLGSLTPLARSAERVVIEITERENLLDVPNWEESLVALSEAGYSLALDDLGAGYNSLSMLASIAPAYIKIDMSIVRDLHESSRKRQLVELLCLFGEATDTTVVAEGIETTAEDRAVRACGVDLLQGYLFGRPQLQLVRG